MQPAQDATVEWMIADVTERCRAAVAALSNHPVGPVQLAGVTMTLRAVVADLLTVVDQLDPELLPRAADEATDAPIAFDLIFDAALADRPDG